MNSPNGQFDLLSIGVCTIDFIFTLERLPEPGTKCSSRDLLVQGGGVGGNIAWNAARMGLSAAIVAKVGDDLFAEEIRREFAAVGVEIGGLVFERGGRTPLTSILVDGETGERTCIHNRTGVTPLTEEDVNNDFSRLARLVVADGRYPEATRRCMELARGAIRVIALEWFNTPVLSLCEDADAVVMPAELLGSRSGDELREFASDTGARAVVATLGANGCRAFDGTGCQTFPGKPCRVVDTVGAGDAFTAGLCLALVRGGSLADACRFANVIGACSCESAGARNGIPSFERLPELGFESNSQ